ncbi:recombinase family protein [Bosea eneae]|uniref:Recombinase family protein n=1 Tax=Bosea eneae TaxID=151454 RepID=A0ABW0ITY9_9HYPH
MNIAVYVVDREGVGQGVIQAQVEHALKSLIRKGVSVGQALVYVEREDSVPAVRRPRLTVLTEDAARGGFDRVVISTLRDFGPDPEEQSEIVTRLRRLGVHVEIAPHSGGSSTRRHRH